MAATIRNTLLKRVEEKKKAEAAAAAAEALEGDGGSTDATPTPIASTSKLVPGRVPSPNRREMVKTFFGDIFPDGIRQRVSDGYYSATDMCAAGDRRWVDYWRNDGTAKFIQCLSKEVSIEPTTLVEINQSGPMVERGTYVRIISFV